MALRDVVRRSSGRRWLHEEGATFLDCSAAIAFFCLQGAG
jgi:hypothetical protein